MEKAKKSSYTILIVAILLLSLNMSLLTVGFIKQAAATEKLVTEVEYSNTQYTLNVTEFSGEHMSVFSLPVNSKDRVIAEQEFNRQLRIDVGCTECGAPDSVRVSLLESTSLGTETIKDTTITIPL